MQRCMVCQTEIGDDQLREYPNCPNCGNPWEKVGGNRMETETKLLDRHEYKAYLHKQVEEGDNGGFETFAGFLKCVVDAQKHGKWDSRLDRWHGAAVEKAMTIGTDSAGGFLVPTQWQAMLLAKSLETSIIMPRCFVIPMKTDSIQYPAIDETSRTSTVHGGISFSWTAEAGTISPTQPALGQNKLEAHKLAGLCRLTNELLQDSTPSAEAIVTRLFSEALAFFRDESFIHGTGVAQPLGVMNSPCKIAVDPEDGQAANSVVFSNLVKMFERLPDESKDRAIWLINGECFSQIMSLCLTVGGGPVFLGLNQGAVGPAPQTIFGRPIFWTEHCSALGTEGDIILGDWSSYLVGDRVNIVVETSPHLYFNSDETAIRLKARLDGQPWWSAALTPRRGTLTRSPFVTLADR
jgi:HK97 family phage major capsid protein